MLPAIEEATGSFREVSVKLEDILSKLIRQGLAQSVVVKAWRQVELSVSRVQTLGFRSLVGSASNIHITERSLDLAATHPTTRLLDTRGALDRVAHVTLSTFVEVGLNEQAL